MTPVDHEAFRTALAHWAAGVTIVACRTDERVIATTVSAFMSLSLDPPQVLLAIGPNATVRPFLTRGARFGVSILSAAQRRIATAFADSFPVGPDPFSDAGDPLVTGALVGLGCVVVDVTDGGTHAIIIAAVDVAQLGPEADPLVRFGRAYHRLHPL